MAFTYVLSTDRGKVRLLIPDTRDTGHVFEDDEIDAFLALDSNVYRAAALALETIAADQAMVLKVTQVQDVRVDGRAVADALMKRAATLKAKAAEASGELGFAFIEQARTQDQIDYLIWKDAVSE